LIVLRAVPSEQPNCFAISEARAPLALARMI
jgi:hypothetical protein